MVLELLLELQQHVAKFTNNFLLHFELHFQLFLPDAQLPMVLQNLMLKRAIDFEVGLLEVLDHLVFA
jgi:hypothetical protein